MAKTLTTSTIYHYLEALVNIIRKGINIGQKGAKLFLFSIQQESVTENFKSSNVKNNTILK